MSVGTHSAGEFSINMIRRSIHGYSEITGSIKFY